MGRSAEGAIIEMCGKDPIIHGYYPRTVIFYWKYKDSKLNDYKFIGRVKGDIYG